MVTTTEIHLNENDISTEKLIEVLKKFTNTVSPVINVYTSKNIFNSFQTKFREDFGVADEISDAWEIKREEDVLTIPYGTFVLVNETPVFGKVIFKL